MQLFVHKAEYHAAVQVVQDAEEEEIYVLVEMELVAKKLTLQAALLVPLAPPVQPAPPEQQALLVLPELLVVMTAVEHNVL